MARPVDPLAALRRHARVLPQVGKLNSPLQARTTKLLL